MLPRNKLPQIPTKEIPEFVDFCQENGINVRAVRIGVMNLRPIQKHLNVDKVKKFLYSNEPQQVPLMVSNDNHIMDGHHRWAAAAVNDKTTKILCIKFGCSIEELINFGHSFYG